MPPPAAGSTVNRRPAGQSGSGLGGVRLDRLGRAALCVGAVVLAVWYVSPAVGLIGAWLERSDTSSELVKLQRENASLKAQRDALKGDRGVAQEARRLGMVLPGEIPYVVTGLPGDRR